MNAIPKCVYAWNIAAVLGRLWMVVPHSQNTGEEGMEVGVGRQRTGEFGYYPYNYNTDIIILY